MQALFGIQPWVYALVTFSISTAASASTYTYDLNSSLSSSTGGPDLTADGGTLGATGYSFGPNQGLTLSNVGGPAFSSYSIDLSYFFNDNVTARGNGYRKIIDFADLTSDSGLYSRFGNIELYPNGSGTSTSGSTENGRLADVTLARSSAGIVTVTLDGTGILTYDDSVSKTYLFSNTSTLHFFEDDKATAQGEAAAGFVNAITVTTGSSISTVPLPAAAPMFGAALIALAGFSYGVNRRGSPLKAAA
ncbi:hypothetical protein [Lichenifustis flavocetrariae]|uniref:Uncharacterized protein n=1 Tax=Lichenifustis flavocetrariae TaxID=2949735 RepID=A0AA42CIA2_9HYPH|nr:hypothetical protein [Lichenifustis flavocetrariae]MCW6506631.1 hypothetical protein [Lichenifustis flavocetrariae]